MDDANFQSLSYHEKLICLIGDEMHIKEDLIYDKHNGELTGFINLGDINEHLHQLEDQLETSDPVLSPPLASTVFVFMVRGLFSKLKFPYATFSAKAVTADQLLPLYIEALFRLERCGFKVIGITLDGYSANRRLMSLLSDDDTKSKVKYKTTNPSHTPIQENPLHHKEGSMKRDMPIRKTDPPPNSTGGLFTQAVTTATEDEGFLYLQSDVAKNGLCVAKAILFWATQPSNKSLVNQTSEQLINKLKGFLEKQPSSKALREKLWVSFFDYLKSEEYRVFWTPIIKPAKTQNAPVLFYFIARHILYELIHQMYPAVTPETDVIDESVTLSVDEEAALSYVGGYLIRALIKKVRRRVINEEMNKEKLIEALVNFKESEDECEDDDSEDVTECDNEVDWLTICNRGGLYRVRTEFMNFLTSMEIVVKKVMCKKVSSKSIVEVDVIVRENEEVMFWWEVLCSAANVDNDTAAALLTFVIELYVTLRGFAYTTRWLEVYKIENKKNIQKSKGLRKKLLT